MAKMSKPKPKRKYQTMDNVSKFKALKALSTERIDTKERIKLTPAQKKDWNKGFAAGIKHAQSMERIAPKMKSDAKAAGYDRGRNFVAPAAKASRRKPRKMGD